MNKVGIGYDIHRYKKGRKLILGGKIVPFARGLDGHSDADCLLHAVCDALLGAAGMGDIGEHFPDTDPAYKGISSMELVRAVRALLRRKGFRIGNIDSVIVCQEPRLGGHKKDMARNIAAALGIPVSCVGVKATTPERLGPLGRSQGIACWATALIMKGV
ncbi:MAG: 2-C-methyl-D-erythritol 2,4-cyclodiphosphate synthase [Candidatus Omnitrophica bacterium]|nr:2-C-methyl-D-erythritol 2,4-cyclodiphosphate synthase [Candidatus Omnitrophota bacterium]MDD5775412.1 2-C-methyl-D-erythritol 2,4-cyclodiphosphate synthase [Candidatus Omnitrophota bacterium]